MSIVTQRPSQVLSMGFQCDPATVFEEDQNERLSELQDLAESIFLECRENRPFSTLQTAIFLFYRVLEQRPSPHPLRLTYLGHLSRARLTRFTQTGWVEDFDDVLKLVVEVLNLGKTEGEAGPALEVDETTDVYGTQKLAVDCLEEFHQAADGTRLNMAIRLYYEVLSLRPKADSKRFSATRDLAAALTMRFLLTDRRQDLDEANLLYNDAAKLQSFGDHDRFQCLVSLCAGLMMKFFYTGEYSDVVGSRAAVIDMLEADSGYRMGSQGADLLATYVERSGNAADLHAATSLLYASLSHHPPGHPQRRSTQINIGAALYTRFKLIGNRDDLDEAIACCRETQKLTPAGHPREFEMFINLGIALLERFEHTSESHDLEDSITCFRKALELGSDVTTLGNLGNALVARNQPIDLGEAVSLHRAALDLTPTLHPQRHFTLQNLGLALLKRYPYGGDLHDIKESISFLREALNLTPGGHPARPTSLGYLAFALHTLYLIAGKNTIEYLKEAIDLEQEIAHSLPVNHPRSSGSRNLALHLMELHSVTNDSRALDGAMDAFRVAATCDTCSVLEQFRTAKIWAKYAADGRHSSALEAYSQVIGLFPRLVALDSHLLARQAALSRSEGLAGAAASCAIREGKLEMAVEFLETGRTVFWSQALRLRTPLDELALTAPALAERLRRISSELEKGSFRVPSMDAPPLQLASMEREATRLRHLNNDWNDVLNEVRKLDGFGHFLQPVPFAALKRAAALGPVVMLTASEIGCDALIVTIMGVQHLPLGFFTTKDAKILAQLLHISLSTYRPVIPAFLHDYLEDLKMRSQDRHVKPFSSAAGLSSEDCLRLILERLWNLIVHPVVTSLKLQKSESPRRLWWCPIGPLTFLPIHAAGNYGAKDGDSLIDYAVSSYTSTLNGLLIPPPKNLSPLKMLVVIEPNSPGTISLPCTAAELQNIKSHVSKEYLIELGTADSPNSIDKVLSHLSDVSMVHFACHGSQNIDNPLESALLLSDGPMKVSQIMEKSLVNASLAFLSACETAAGDKKVPDESIHIASAMLFAGFRGVVGTMWSIVDSDAPFVADHYYQHLFKAGPESHPNPHDAATALHLAVMKLRQRTGCSLRRWVPFIHLGI